MPDHHTFVEQWEKKPQQMSKKVSDKSITQRIKHSPYRAKGGMIGILSCIAFYLFIITTNNDDLLPLLFLPTYPLLLALAMGGGNLGVFFLLSLIVTPLVYFFVGYTLGAFVDLASNQKMKNRVMLAYFSIIVVAALLISAVTLLT